MHNTIPCRLGSVEMLILVGPHGKVPLHDACDNHVPLEFIQLMVQLALSTALQIADNDGRLPLHYASEKQCPFEIVQVFVGAFPGAVTSQDERGRLPVL